MKRSNCARPLVALCALFACLAGAGPAAADSSAGGGRAAAEVIGEEVPGIPVDVDLRDLPVEPAWRPGDPIKEIPRRARPLEGDLQPEPWTGIDPLLEAQQAFFGPGPGIVVGLNFNGQGFSGVNPPDTVGDVGPGHYIQMINGGGGALVTVHDKSTGAVIAGPFALDGLGSGNCAAGLGDPVVLYDPLADRWVLSEFSSSGNRLCVYVSRSPDPVTGGWCAYQLTAPGFPDYPKYGVWPDAYYVTTNESSPAIYAFDRENMILGTPTTCGTARAAQRFTAPSLPGFPFEALTPADLDGATPPPPGLPGIVMRHRDTEVHGPAGQPTHDLLEMWAVDIDWTTPANSALVALPAIQVAEFDSDLCGLSSFSCFPQPGTGTQLDPLREVIMFRLAYRNFGSHETLVGNYVTDVDGTNRGGVRWFELRDTGAGWTLEQEGTYSPDATNRWMGAIAMDGAGNLMVGYNVSSASVHPGLRFTGRLAGDAAGVMTLAEQVLVAGTASNSSNRYGDYSAMSVDPTDDCTFWFTGEWNGASSWSTRIGSVKFDACGEPGFTLSATPPAAAVCAGADALFTVHVGSISGYDLPVTLAALGAPAGATVGFSANPLTPPEATTMTVGNTAAIAPGTHTITVQGTATDLSVETDTVDLTVVATSPGAPALTAPADGASGVANPAPLAWTAVAGATSYVVEVDDTADFSSPVFTTTTAATSTTATGLVADTRYYWRVTAANACGTGASSAPFRFRTAARYCRAPNLPIPDGSPTGVTDLLTVPAGANAILDLDVELRVTHGWVGDIAFSLEHLGTTRVIFDRPGVPATQFGCSGDHVDALFSDEAANPAETSCSNTTGLTTGPYSPDQTFSAFDGTTLSGTWTITARDPESGFPGTLDEWCLVPMLDPMPFWDDFETGDTGRWTFSVGE